ncbi:acriflavin resistance protein [Photobacterium aquae]|uniref:Acriflavin resistance protein n=1 Tax=Photobacterium aquae TaxID=1195763 RepID=A0A0J1GYC8_9GAMM|nr:efflux RND transporter periplasmic adaptor subunit [Photobacterium aquae]KLV04670.1 acriflavin resistance protein [Photobacterium aquae]
MPATLSPVARIAAAILIGSILTGCNQANSEPAREIVKPVKLYQVPVAMEGASTSFPARAEAAQRAQLSFQVPGEIARLTVRVGEQVRQGQVLAQLDDRDYRLAFDAKLAEYELADSQFVRAKQLYAKKLISTDQYDQRETAYKAALANLDQAKTDLEHTLLRAPFDGVVSLKHVNQHQFVGANQPVLNIQNTQQLDLSFSLPVSFVEQSDLASLAESPVWIEMDNHAAKPIVATLKELSTQPEPDTNTYTAKVSITRPSDLNILTGMAGQVHFAKPDAHRAMVLPEGAWIERDGLKGRVWQFNPATHVVNALELTLDSHGAVVAGLPQGSMVVIAGAKELLPGQQVRAWEREGGI